jgi:hypothetical protein
MKSNFHEKRQQRIENLEAAAEKAEQRSTQAYQQAKQIGSFIPMGQPILVGHHSEGRHRRDIAKIDNSMRKSCEESEKAAYYASRAQSAANNTAISSDDPEAVVKLKKKLKGMQECQEFMKEVNKILRQIKAVQRVPLTDDQKATFRAKLEALRIDGREVSEKIISGLMEFDFMGRYGFPSYSLSNNTQNMTTVKKRIQELMIKEELRIEEYNDLVTGIRVFSSPETNRTQIFFPDQSIPPEDLRSQMKRNGFRWAPSEKAWQCYFNARSHGKAMVIIEGYYNPERGK